MTSESPSYMRTLCPALDTDHFYHEPRRQSAPLTSHSALLASLSRLVPSTCHVTSASPFPFQGLSLSIRVEREVDLMARAAGSCALVLGVSGFWLAGWGRGQRGEEAPC